MYVIYVCDLCLGQSVVKGRCYHVFMQHFFLCIDYVFIIVLAQFYISIIAHRYNCYFALSILMKYIFLINSLHMMSCILCSRATIQINRCNFKLSVKKVFYTSTKHTLKKIYNWSVIIIVE